VCSIGAVTRLGASYPSGRVDPAEQRESCPSMAQPTRRFHLPFAVRPSSVRIVPDAVRALLADGATLVDVRRQDDHTAKLDGALRITPDAIPEWIAEIRRDVPIVLACT
jgi:hypothetical protein